MQTKGVEENAKNQSCSCSKNQTRTPEIQLNTLILPYTPIKNKWHFSYNGAQEVHNFDCSHFIHFCVIMGLKDAVRVRWVM